MTSTAIVTDSTADLPADLVARLGVTVVPLTVTLDGQSYLDGVEISASEFYAKLQRSQGSASTSQPSPGRFAEAYGRLLEEHEHVLSIHISEKLSGTLASARQAAAISGAPRIRTIDSEGASMQLGLLVLIAATLTARGAGLDEAVAGVNAARTLTRSYFTVGTLEHLRRGGRIGRASALLGSMLQVKPVLTIQDGLVTPLERVRTYERALGRLLELARSVDTGGGLCAVVGHAAQPDAAARLARDLEGCTETLLIHPVGPVVGAHAGPGTVGIGCYPAELLALGLGGAFSATASR